MMLQSRYFLSNTAHELRRPLHAILGYTELLLDTEISGPQRQDLRIVDGQARLLWYNIEGLLDLAKIEKGSLELETKPFGLRSTIEEVITVMAMFAEEKKLFLAHSIDTNLPDAFLGDPIRLGQIVANLINNAIKFTDVGQVTVRLAGDALPDGQRWRLVGHVTDTRTGIAPEKWHVIFQLYEQVKSNKTKNWGGLGLGLAICRHLVEHMGGSVEVESSSLGRGTTFRFEVLVELDPDKPKAGEPPAPVWLSGRSVLVAVPSASQREPLVELLVRWGMEASAFKSLDGVVKHLESQVWPHVALLDTNLGVVRK